MSGDRRPRVSLVITCLDVGGAERQLAYLAVELAKRGWAPSVFSILPDRGHFPELYDAGIALSTGTFPATDWRLAWDAPIRLFRHLREWRPLVAVSFLDHANLLTRFVARIAGVPVHVASLRSERFEGHGRELLFRVTRSLSQGITVNSSRVAAALRRRGLLAGQQHAVIPNALDLERVTVPRSARSEVRQRLGWGDDEFVWVCVGRLAPQKDYPTLLRAWAGIREPRARLAIVGDGDLHDDLQALIRALGLADRVQFLGRRGDVPMVLRAADALVLASHYEGMPNAVMEAMALELPVVATRVSGTPELVQEGETGFLVPPGDAEALSRAMAAVMQMPVDVRLGLGEAGRAFIEARHRLPVVMDQWDSLLRSLLADAGHSPTASTSVQGTRNSRS